MKFLDEMHNDNGIGSRKIEEQLDIHNKQEDYTPLRHQPKLKYVHNMSILASQGHFCVIYRTLFDGTAKNQYFYSNTINDIIQALMKKFDETLRDLYNTSYPHIAAPSYYKFLFPTSPS